MLADLCCSGDNVHEMASPARSSSPNVCVVDKGKLQFGVLDTSLRRATSVVRRLLNGMRPINRLPTEILLDIFSLVPRKRPFLKGMSATIWPFFVPNIDDLRAASQVCTRWREVALGAPALWSAYREDYVYRRSITLYSLYLARCPTGPIDIYVNDSFSRVKQLLLERGHQVRQLHVEIGGGRDEDARQLVATLPNMTADVLEHCSLLLPPVAYARLQQSSSLCRHGTATRLRSLFLSVTRVLPQWELPSLIRCVLSEWQGRSEAIDPSSLLTFLSGTPNLEILHLEKITVSPFQQTPPPQQQIPLTRLRYLSYTPSSGIISLDFLLHILRPSRCQLDIDGVELDRIFWGDVQNAVRTLHGAALPTKMGIHVRRQIFGTAHVSLELARGASPDWSGCTRIQFKPFSNTAQFWRSLLTPDFCAEVEEVRVDITGYCEDGTAMELAAIPIWPLFVKIRELSLAFRWDATKNEYLRNVRSALELLFPQSDALAVRPCLDTLNVYVDVGDAGVIQYFADFLAARTARGRRVRRFVLGGPEDPPLGVARLMEHVDEFFWLEYEDPSEDWMDIGWPVPIDRDDGSALIGADWPTWIS